MSRQVTFNPPLPARTNAEGFELWVWAVDGDYCLTTKRGEDAKRVGGMIPRWKDSWEVVFIHPPENTG